MSAVAKGQELVEGERQESYGHPLDNFTRIASFWTTFLDKKLAPGQSVTVEDVGYLMALLKMAREVNKPNPDNPVDVAGYMHCLTLIEEERERRAAA